jgi:hypothetical protein
MESRSKIVAVVFGGVTFATTLVTGCGAAETDVVTFTDVHERNCTATVTNGEVTALDCEYPPGGKSPSHEEHRTPLPSPSPSHT